MKKITLFVLTLLSISSQAQEQIDFTIKYLPNHEYTLSQTVTSENNLNYIASDELLEELKSNGINNPTVTKETSLLKNSFKTGSLVGNTFPITIDLLESNNPVLTKGTKFFGNSVADKIKIDSISSNSITKDQKAMLISVMESILNQIEYPDKKLKVGEGFTQSIPMNIPIANVNLEMTINSTYTLKSISNGIAFFDLGQVYTLKTEVEGSEIKFNGAGTGSINYDIEKQFFSKYYVTMEMDFKMDLEPFSIEIKSKSTTDQITTIKQISK